MWWLMMWSALAAPVASGEAVQAALEIAPTVVEAQARVEAARGARRQASGPQHNPELQLGATPTGSRVQGQVLQPLSLTGEGVHGRRAAGAELEAAEAALIRARLETAAAARHAYARLSSAEAALVIGDKQLRGASRLRGAAEVRLEAGGAPQLDAQLARLEEARAVAIWLSAGKDVIAARSDLVALTGLPTDVEVAHDPLEAARGLDGASADKTRSDVNAAEAGVAAARASLASERAAVAPPVGLGVFYEAGAGSLILGPMVTVQIPVWNRNQGSVAAARAKLMAAEAELVATRGRAQVQTAAIDGRLAAVTRAEGLLAADLAEDATTALAAIEQAYTLGEVDLNTALLLQARVMDGERGWYVARASMAETRIDVALAAEDASLAGTR